MKNVCHKNKSFRCNALVSHRVIVLLIWSHHHRIVTSDFQFLYQPYTSRSFSFVTNPQIFEGTHASNDGKSKQFIQHKIVISSYGFQNKNKNNEYSLWAIATLAYLFICLLDKVSAFEMHKWFMFSSHQKPLVGRLYERKCSNKFSMRILIECRN